MKKGIHPEYHTIKVTAVDGSVIEMHSTVAKDITLDTDPSNHPAWTGQRASVERGQRVNKFKAKFGDFKL
ncbi:MAG: 50S ribosomal protein L31 [Rickettsiales bacterium]|jgi:large subunit ribosomal protein L31|nr:50S ribosomal protein L31 [Rickettsiales bacterium]